MVGSHAQARDVNNTIIENQYNYFLESSQSVSSLSNEISPGIDNFKRRLQSYYAHHATIKLPVFDCPQPIDKSYIHLALITHQEPVFSASSSSIAPATASELQLQTLTSLSLPKRLQSYEDHVFTVDPTQEMKLAHLWQDTHRVMIIGRAGIGKSTFCKYALHHWQQVGEQEEASSWQKFNIVYWLPLRYLLNYKLDDKNDYQDDDLAAFIHYVFSQQCDNRSLLPCKKVKEIQDTLEREENTTLFLLDGYDEVADLNAQSPRGRFLQFLLQQPNYLMTSRPHAIQLASRSEGPLSNITHRYELLGFQDEDIFRYIDKVVKLKKQSLSQQKEEVVFKNETYAEAYTKSLLALLDDNACIWGIAHVPINLALLCAVWKPELSEETSSKTISMTQLYDYIVRRLYEINLQKYKLTFLAQKKLDNQGPRLFFHPINVFLGELALTGLLTQTLLFSSETLKQTVLNHEQGLSDFFNQFDLNKQKEGYLSGELLEQVSKLGFWHGLWQTPEGPQCEFLHLTFQEYFAAHYLVMWIRGEISLPETQQTVSYHYNNTAYDDPYALLAAIAKEQRFEIVLWFVAGLIREFADSETAALEQLNPFFERVFRVSQLSHEPDSALSLYIAGRCLEESQMPAITQQDRLFTSYKNLVFKSIIWVEGFDEYALYYLSTLYYLSISPVILNQLGVMDTLEKRSSRNSSFSYTQLSKGSLAFLSFKKEWKPLINLISSISSPKVKSTLMACIVERGKNASEILDYLKRQLVNEHKEVREASLIHLLQLERKERIVEELMQELSSGNWNVRQWAAEKLIQLGKEEVLVQGCMQGLSSENWNVRQWAVEKLMELGKEESLVKQTLVNDLLSENGEVRQRAAEKLIRLGKEEVLVQGLVQALPSENDEVRQWAAEKLIRLGKEEVLVQGCMQALSSENWNVRQWAAEKLIRLDKEEVLVQGCMQALSSENWNVRQWAAEKLIRLGKEEGLVIQTLVKDLASENSEVRQWAVEKLIRLGKEEGLATQTLVKDLASENSEVRQWAAEKLIQLGKEKGLATQTLVKDLASENREVRQWAGWILIELGKKEVLVQGLVQALSSENSEVRQWAAEKLIQLGKEENLLIQALVSNLSSRDIETRSRAEETLKYLPKPKKWKQQIRERAEMILSPSLRFSVHLTDNAQTLFSSFSYSASQGNVLEARTLTSSVEVKEQDAIVFLF